MPTPRPHARVVVLLHAAYRRRDLRTTAIYHLAELWREDGLEVAFGFGTRRVPEGDLAILHVDLSVVPAPYARLAARYPIALNARILDIRKTTYSAHRLRREDAYDGPVIVKTDLNSAGRPERLATPRLLREVRRLARRLGWRSLAGMKRLQDYRIFETRHDVPDAVWRDRRFLVEAFLPQRIGPGYAIHSAFVLGGVRACERMESPHPIICDGTAAHVESVACDPRLDEPCAALGLDYGKIDYTVHAGGLAVLDVNKTVGSAVSGANPDLAARRRIWAAGLLEYLDGRRSPA